MIIQFVFGRLYFQTCEDEMMIEDQLTNPIVAKELISLFIQCMKKELHEFLKKKKLNEADDNVKWILTMPTIWGQSAKQCVKKSAEQVIRIL